MCQLSNAVIDMITKQYHQVYVIVSDNRFLRKALESNGNASVVLQSKQQIVLFDLNRLKCEKGIFHSN